MSIRWATPHSLGRIAHVDTVRHVVNTANQIACIDTNAGGTCNGSETLWVYDAYGNLTSDANDLGSSTTYTYDTANRVSSITAAGVNDLPVVTTYTSYDYNGDRISQTVTEGSITTTTMYVLDTATPLTAGCRFWSADQRKLRMARKSILLAPFVFSPFRVSILAG